MLDSPWAVHHVSDVIDRHVVDVYRGFLFHSSVLQEVFPGEVSW